MDDPRIFNAGDGIIPSDLIPPNANGHVIITSRRTDLSDLGDQVCLGPLTDDEAARLLLSKSYGRQECEDDGHTARSIVGLLGCVPLAVEQRASFVKATGGVLKDYAGSFNHLMRAINIPDVEESRDSFRLSNSRTILTTWEISFRQLEEVCADAAQLLAILGCMDGSDISESLLVEGFRPQRCWGIDGNPSNSFSDKLPYWVNIERQAQW